MGATKDWRNHEEAEERVRGEERRRRPGVTWDIGEDPPDAVLEAKLTRSASRRRIRRPSQPES